MTTAAATPAAMPAAPRKPWYKILYVQVLIAIILGALVGWLFPDVGKNDWVKALGDGFVKLIRMVIAPIIFCTVVSGIAHISQVSKVGRVGRQGAGLFRSGIDFRAGPRPACRQPASSGRRVRRPQRRQRGRQLRQAGAAK